MSNKKRTKQDALNAEKFLAQLVEVFSTEAGVAVANTILTQCHILEDVFQTSNMNAYLQGRQSVGQWLLGLIIEADPGLATRIMMLGMDRMHEDAKLERFKLIDGADEAQD